ncbi:alpha/beta hydrolase [Fictibacillus sp. 18YEL24]|uniref:alpha/beta hydrolase n=1 Tax=Fictibacillus sp. 18YEL24 TaxID=2745875 RepID=UPI0018CF5B78|nr:alpha/beta hydrolase [Fictibacillus sp. 18YEL24]MBH0170053.1 alpha/beta hydrolase [Fictibacillus sp. 18YEL24]
MKNRSNYVIGYKNLKIPYVIQTKTDQPKGLAIMLPGIGYTVKSPLFHFSSGAFLNKGYDVLHVNYPYSSTDYEDFSLEEITSALINDVSKVLNEVVDHTFYKSYYVIGKSFGTMAIPTALDMLPSQSTKAIWLTPRLIGEQVFQTLRTCTQDSLCVIGDKDPFYDIDKMNHIIRNPSIECMMPPGANHALEVDNDILTSIDMVKSVMKRIDDFISLKNGVLNHEL